MNDCPYCYGNGCSHCMPIPKHRTEYYVADPESNESIPCTEEEYYRAAEEYREAVVIPL